VFTERTIVREESTPESGRFDILRHFASGQVREPTGMV
jgi:hypothetical protein